MEAVPRLPMVSFDLKVSAEPAEFGPKIKQYIRDFYHEDPESYSKEIKDLTTLRNNAVRAPKDVTGCSILKQYYCQLHSLQSRFPMMEDGAAAVNFSWLDCFSGVVYSASDIRYEMGCVLFNVGSLHSILGAADSRTSADGMKMSCTHFQCAAWAFQHLRDTLPQPRGSDMSPEILQFMYQIMLAQAQECILEKSMMDNRKATIIAKVAAQIVDYYKLAQNTLVQGNQGGSENITIAETVGSKRVKSWQKYVNFKSKYHLCVSLLYQGQQAEEQQKMGERVAYYLASSQALEEAANLSKGMDNAEAVSETLTFTRDVVEGKLKAARADNEFIYHERVPAREVLPEIHGASLVKGIPFDVNDPEVSGQELFSRLVPMRAHEASSLYSEEKAKLLRKVGSSIEEKDQEVVAFMSSLQLDHLLEAKIENERFPQELVERCAALSAKPNAIQELIDSMGRLAEIYHDVEGMLQEISSYLQEEEEREKEYQTEMGARPPSIAATDLTREAGKYREAHARGSESNQALHRAMALHVTNLRLLAMPLPQLQETIPSVKAASAALSSDAKDGLSELRRLMAKVDEMRQQRATLSSQLRESVCADDITRRLVTLSSSADQPSQESLFQQELQKHQKYVTLVEQNLAAQERILAAVTDVYAKQAATRRALGDVAQQREATINALCASYDAYEDLLAKAAKGLEFYRRLEASVSKLLQRVKSVCKVQQEEREQRSGRSRQMAPKMKAVTPAKGCEDDDDTNSSDYDEKPTGPKLKDYLQAGKTYGIGAYPSAQPLSAYYSANMGYIPPGIPTGNPESSLGSATWNLPARPNPVGSEGKPELQACAPPALEINQASSQVSHYCQPEHMPSMQYSDPSASTASTFSQVSNTHGYQQPPSLNSSSYSGHPGYGYNPITGQYQYSSGYQTSLGGAYPVSQTVTPSPLPPGSVASAPSPNMPPSTQINGSSSWNPQSSLPSTMHSQLPHMPQGYREAIYGDIHGGKTVLPSMSSNLENQQPNIPSTVPYGSTYLTGNDVYLRYAPPSMGPSQYTSAGTYGTNQTDSGQNSGTQGMQNTANIPRTEPYSNVNPVQDPYGYYGSSQTGVRPPLEGSVGGNSASYPQKVDPVYERDPYYQSTYMQARMPSSIPETTYSQQQPEIGHSGYPDPSLGQYYLQNPVLQHSASTLPQNLPTTLPYGTMASVTPQVTVTSQSSVPSSVSLPHSMANTHPQMNATAHSPHSQLPPSGMANMTQLPQSAMPGNSQLPHSVIPSGNQLPQSGIPNATQYPQSGMLNASQLSQSGMSTMSQLPQTGIPNMTQMPGSALQPVQPQSIHYGVDTQHNTQAMSPYHIQGQVTSVPNTLPQQSMNPPPAQVKNPLAASFSSSNVDLLAGLDFSSSHSSNLPPPPLIPQTKAKVPEVSQLKESSSTASVPGISGVSSSSGDSTPQASPAHNLPDAPVKGSKEAIKIKPEVAEEIKSTVPVVASKSVASQLQKDPLDGDPESLSLFVSEVERFEKLVEGLTKKSLNGPTPLDLKWKELQDMQEKDSHKRSISVARCYPMKNRLPDVLPYDHSRVELPSTKDDYINASHIRELTPLSPPFIVTQSPLPSTFNDFWTMVWEQQVEVIACLLSDAELEGQFYWPREKGAEMPMGKMKLVLQTCNTRTHWVERVFSLTMTDTRATHSIVHLQFMSWPGSSFPPSPGPFLQYVCEALSVWRQQSSAGRVMEGSVEGRGLEGGSHRGRRPLLVHCLSGAGRAGLFCLLAGGISEIGGKGAGAGPLSELVSAAAGRLSQQRRGALRDRQHLLFTFQALLYHAQDLLMKRGILTSRSTFEEAAKGSIAASKSSSSHARHPSQDFLLSNSASLSQLQSGMEKMGLASPADSDTFSISSHSGEIGKASEEHQNLPTVGKVDCKPASNDIGSEEQGASLTINSPMKSESFGSLKNLFPLESGSNANVKIGKGFTQKQKSHFTRENFNVSNTGEAASLAPEKGTPGDPLSQLDPLWSLKKK
ncbi:tyrosine-protein phosphatase non-receptor type 23 isoform X2 [Ischnura elegans]|uniref:tyrosine-protein phosphatase non-receptor type 23 isoform X2 n=1 Tax=Ischnura elegans TaxID=197161 RepID=UPI001ED8ADD9|nr:tyrosine-protein phosphatase non-receptor type 23 isoform X2 [Ischnura elegans]